MLSHSVMGGRIIIWPAVFGKRGGMAKRLPGDERPLLLACGLLTRKSNRSDNIIDTHTHKII